MCSTGFYCGGVVFNEGGQLELCGMPTVRDLNLRHGLVSRCGLSWAWTTACWRIPSCGSRAALDTRRAGSGRNRLSFYLPTGMSDSRLSAFLQRWKRQLTCFPPICHGETTDLKGKIKLDYTFSVVAPWRFLIGMKFCGVFCF